MNLQLFFGYRTIDLSRIHACKEILKGNECVLVVAKLEVAKLFQKTQTLRTPCEFIRIFESVSLFFNPWWKNRFPSNFHDQQTY